MALTLNTPGVVAVDDSSSSVDYQPSGGWLTAGVSEEFHTTTHGTTVDGSSATISFRGTSVAVYGTLGPEGTPVSTYALDGSSAVTFNAPSVVSPVHQTLFYQSPNLPDGEHTLVVTFVQDAIYWLDYFLYLPASTPSSSPSSPPQNPTSSSPQNPPSSSPQNPPSSPPQNPPNTSPHSDPQSTTATLPPSASPSSSTIFSSASNGGHVSTNSQFTSHVSTVGGSFVTTKLTSTSSALAVSTGAPSVLKANTNVGAIVGGSLGAAFILLLGAAFLLLFRQRRRDTHINQEVEPFQSLDMSPDMYDNSTTPTSKSGLAYGRSERANRAGSGSQVNDTSSRALSSPSTGESRVRLHHDGGVRIAGGAPDESRPLSPGTTVDIPPAYGRY